MRDRGREKEEKWGRGNEREERWKREKGNERERESGGMR